LDHEFLLITFVRQTTVNTPFMKKLLFCLLFLGLFTPGWSQEKKYDTIAIVILDHMSAIVGDLTSCRFRLEAETDLADPDAGVVTNHEMHDVSFTGPDRMLLESWGDKGHRGYWYNGSTLTWYSFTENNYVVIPAPARTIDMIDSVYETYGIDFPASDFFNPTLSDDLINLSDNITYQGKTTVNGRSCYQVAATSKDVSVQFWVSDDLRFLPLKMVLVYNGKSRIKRYEVLFTDWEVNPNLPAAIFEFAVPPGANQISILSRK
jgi:hypothetical protein